MRKRKAGTVSARPGGTSSYLNPLQKGGESRTGTMQLRSVHRYPKKDHFVPLRRAG